MAEKFGIKKLFGRFDYVLPLDGGGVTLLTGPNGFGKSTILSMIGYAAERDERSLFGVPFEEFSYERGGVRAAVSAGGAGDLAALGALIGPVKRIGGRGGEATIGALKAYAADIEDVPERIKSRIKAVPRERAELFMRLIGGKLAFKTPVLDEGGLRFVTADGQTLPYDNLSLGEAKMIAFFFELVLCSPDGGLVLIDEPEASMHVVWQLRLVDEIKLALSALGGARAIVCTHSPQVIGGHRELMVDLGAQYEG